MRCPWCHNPEGISREIQTDALGAIYGRVMTAQQVYAEVVKDRAYYDMSGGGVTFTGGEPLYNAAFVAAAAELIKRGGINVAIETSGAAPLSGIETILPYTDGVLFDIKSFDGERLRETVGADINVVMRSLQSFSEAGIPITLRSPVICGFNDDDEHFARLGEFAARTKNVRAVELLPYHRLGADKRRRLGMTVYEFEEIDREKIERAVRLVRMNFKNVSAT